MQAGMCLNGYTLLARLSAPGGLEVWKARTSSGHMVVIKTASPNSLNDHSFAGPRPGVKLEPSSNRWGALRTAGIQSAVYSYAGLLCFLPLWPILGITPAFTIALLLQTVSACGTFLALVYLGWQAIDDDKSTLRPREAALLLLVPLWGLFWAYQAVARYGIEYNRFARRHSLQLTTNSRMYQWLYWALVTAFVAEVVSLLVISRLLIELLMLQILAIIPALSWLLSVAASKVPRPGSGLSRTEPAPWSASGKTERHCKPGWAGTLPIDSATEQLSAN